MDLPNYKKRIIDEQVDTYLGTFGAVLIEGPKWCGKTWTAKKHSNSEFLLTDPKGNFNNKSLALMDPSFVLEGATPRLIDEWQEVPALWDAVRGWVDTHPASGQFLLTGSATINKHRYIHTGTGRIARLKMRTMSLYESGYSSGLVSLEDICNNVAPNVMTGEVQLKDLIRYILLGGWPLVTDSSIEKGLLIAKEYVKSVLNEDIYKIDDVERDSHKVELLLRSLARNEATTASNAILVKDIKDKDFDDVNVDTLANYMDILKNLHLIENIPPYSSKFRSGIRVKQSEKRHFVDPSLPCALLGLTEKKLLGDLELLGFLFESMVERDLWTYTESFGAKLFHYQDYKNNEMDAVIELPDGAWCGVEIKLGANKIDEAAENLLRIQDAIKASNGKTAQALCVICGLANAAYRRPDGVYVVPITALKN